MKRLSLAIELSRPAFSLVFCWVYQYWIGKPNSANGWRQQWGPSAASESKPRTIIGCHDLHGVVVRREEVFCWMQRSPESANPDVAIEWPEEKRGWGSEIVMFAPSKKAAGRCFKSSRSPRRLEIRLHTHTLWIFLEAREVCSHSWRACLRV